MLWMSLLKAFVIGGFICAVGQVVINLTKLTNGKILVIFLVAGVALEGFGLYTPLIEFAGAGASVPISGFGCALVNGAMRATEEIGIFGVVKGGLEATAPGVSTAIVSAYLLALFCRPKTKKK